MMFIPQAAKINSINYQELVLERVLNNAGQELFESGTFIIQQDAAPAHNSKATQSWLRANYPCFNSKEEWPPYCPDLNLMDYSVLSILQTNACSDSHRNIKALKQKLCQEWAIVPQEILCAQLKPLLIELSVSSKIMEDILSNH